MALHPVQDCVSPRGELLPACLALEILDLLLRAMCPIPHQRMGIPFDNSIVFATFVREKVAFCLDPLLWAASPLARLPGFRLLAFPAALFSLVFSTETAVPLALGSQNSWVSRTFPLFLLVEESPKPILAHKPIDFIDEDQDPQGP